MIKRSSKKKPHSDRAQPDTIFHLYYFNQTYINEFPTKKNPSTQRLLGQNQPSRARKPQIIPSSLPKVAAHARSERGREIQYYNLTVEHNSIKGDLFPVGGPMDTKIWGPKLWNLLYELAKSYTKIKRQDVVRILTSLQYAMPCMYCRSSYRYFFARFPISDALPTKRRKPQQQKMLTRWLWNLKNQVKHKLQLQTWIQVVGLEKEYTQKFVNQSMLPTQIATEPEIAVRQAFESVFAEMSLEKQKAFFEMRPQLEYSLFQCPGLNLEGFEKRLSVNSAMVGEDELWDLFFIMALNYPNEHDIASCPSEDPWLPTRCSLRKMTTATTIKLLDHVPEVYQKRQGTRIFIEATIECFRTIPHRGQFYRCFFGRRKGKSAARGSLPDKPFQAREVLVPWLYQKRLAYNRIMGYPKGEDESYEDMVHRYMECQSHGTAPKDSRRTKRPRRRVPPSSNPGRAVAATGWTRKRTPMKRIKKINTNDG